MQSTTLDAPPPHRRGFITARTAGLVWAFKGLLLGPFSTAWRWGWSLLPGEGGAMRRRIALLARRMLGALPPRQYLYDPRDQDHVRQWIAAHATPGKADLAAIRSHIGRLRAPPRLSVLLDAQGAAPADLRRTIGSVTGQLYPHWDLFVLGATDGAILDQNPLIRRQPAGTSFAPGDELGEWVLRLVAGDVLAATALYEIAAEADAHPGAAIIYGDEYRGNPSGSGVQPWFKPDFDADLLLSTDLFGLVVAYSRDLLDEIGCLAGAPAAASPHAIALRAAAAAGATRIRHIPTLLNDWSPGLAPPPNPAATRVDVAAALAARGIEAEVLPAPLLHQACRVVWPVPSPPLVSVIVPTRDRASLLEACARGVLDRTDYRALEFIIVDNGSEAAETHALFDTLRQDSRVRILAAPGPFNYSYLNNKAATVAQGEIFLLLNNDVEVIHGDWLTELVSHAIRPDVGAVGAKLLYANGTLQHGGVVTGVGGVAAHYMPSVARDDPGYFGSLALVREVAAVTGACLALRRSVFESVGGLDETNLAVAFNDVDLCLKIRQAGWRILWTPYAELYHLESASRGEDILPEKARRFLAEIAYMQQRWGNELVRDPYYNPNLDGPSGAFVSPPRRRPTWADARLLTGR